jgi:hypothetical protein
LKSQSSRARKAGFAPSAGRHYLVGMTDRPKRPRDANQLAHMIVGLATGEDVVHDADTSGQRKGGLKGGKARADKLSPEERAEIAKKAAKARWG